MKLDLEHDMKQDIYHHLVYKSGTIWEGDKGPGVGIKTVNREKTGCNRE